MWVIEASENAKCLPAWSLIPPFTRTSSGSSPPFSGATAKVIVKVGVSSFFLLLPLRRPEALHIEQKLLAANIGAAPTTTADHPSVSDADLLRASSPARAFGGSLLRLDSLSSTRPLILFPKLLLQAGRTSLREPYYLYALNSRGLYQSRLAMHFPTPSAMSKLENIDAT